MAGVRRYEDFDAWQLAEALVELDYFTEEDCREAVRFAKRCFVAVRRLKESQIRHAEGLRNKDRRRPKRKPAPRRGKDPRNASAMPPKIL
jgi:hypothetical protein